MQDEFMDAMNKAATVGDQMPSNENVCNSSSRRIIGNSSGATGISNASISDGQISGVNPNIFSNGSTWYDQNTGSVVSYGKSNMSKHHKISQIDDDDRIEMKDMDLHIQPTHNGFALTFMQDGDASFYTFGCLEEMFKFISDMGMMDLSSKVVADSV